MQRRGIGEKIHREFAIASSVFPARSTYDHVIGGDIRDHILSCIFVVKKVTGIGTVRIPESYKNYRNRTIPYDLKGMDPEMTASNLDLCRQIMSWFFNCFRMAGGKGDRTLLFQFKIIIFIANVAKFIKI